MITVCSRPSISRTCRIRAAKARASASRLASLKGLSISMLLPPATWTRGNRSKSFLRFDLGPGNPRQEGVEFSLDEIGPYRLHVPDAGGGVVAQLSRSRQKRL